jgi:hypothetical protein
MTADAEQPLGRPGDVATAMSEAVVALITEFGDLVDGWDRQAVALRSAAASSRRFERPRLVGKAEGLEELARTLNLEVGVLLRAWEPCTDAPFRDAWEAADRIAAVAADMGAHVNAELLAHWEAMRNFTNGAAAAGHGKRKRSCEGALEVIEEGIASVARLNIEWSALMLVLARRLAELSDATG